MATIVSKRMLVLTSVEDNNNKFWEATLFDTNDVLCRWGRVGADGQSKTFPGVGQKYIDSKIREKQKKGYKEMQVVDAPCAVTSKVDGSALKTVAKKQIKHNSPLVDQLIDFLVKVNRHDITTASGGRLTVDSSGLIKTDLGVAVTQETLDRARKHLVLISTCINKKDIDSQIFIQNINEYLMCVPQKVGARRGWEKSFITSDSDIQRQAALIDSMESTLKTIASRPVVDDAGHEEEVFNVELVLLDDKKQISRINDLYRATLQNRHASSHLRVANVYAVDIKTMRNAFENDGAKLSNIWELWHGTRAANLLSILKSGLVIPSANAAHVTGRMFGNGAYFSDQSTKSLNYSYGYWDGGSRDNICYMFLADVGMGKYYIPSHSVQSIPKGYDSCFAKAGQSSVVNNEMIVYRISQCNLKWLVEFKS